MGRDISLMRELNLMDDCKQEIAEHCGSFVVSGIKTSEKCSL